MLFKKKTFSNLIFLLLSFKTLIYSCPVSLSVGQLLPGVVAVSARLSTKTSHVIATPERWSGRAKVGGKRRRRRKRRKKSYEGDTEGINERSLLAIFHGEGWRR